MKDLNEYGKTKLNISIKNDLIAYLQQIAQIKFQNNRYGQDTKKKTTFFTLLQKMIAKQLSNQIASFQFKEHVDFDKQSIDLFFTKIYYGELSDVQISFYLQNSEKEQKSKFEMKLNAVMINNEPQIILQIQNISVEEQIQTLINLDQYKDQLLGNVAHDLRNPLSSMLYLIDESVESSDFSEIKKNLSLSKVSGSLLMTLINDILDYCQSKQNKLRLNIESFNLTELVKETYQMMSISAKLKKVTLNLQSKLPKEFYITSDRRRIQQVLINLISNSIKFTQQGIVKLKVYIPETENLINFEVLDEGSGIPLEIQNQLGQPFMTFGTTTNSNVQGIGLGLNLCKMIISHLGPNKSFIVSSKIGKGSKFSFQLYEHLQLETILDNKSSEEENNEKQNLCLFSEFSSVNIGIDNYSEQLSSQSQSQTEIRNNDIKINTLQLVQNDMLFQQDAKILIVDDNGFSNLVMKKQLLKISSQFQILEASNGLSAVNQFKEQNKPQRRSMIKSVDQTLNNRIKLIILDSQMPIMGGFEACNEIKTLIKEQNYQNTIIIGCTGLVTGAERLQAKNVGMEEILQKPCNLEILQKIIFENL